MKEKVTDEEHQEMVDKMIYCALELNKYFYYQDYGVHKVLYTIAGLLGVMLSRNEIDEEELRDTFRLIQKVAIDNRE